MNYKSSFLANSIISIFVLILFSGCSQRNTSTKDSNIIQADNYSVVSHELSDNNSSIGKKLSEEQAATDALQNNPNYKIAQLKADIAQDKYHESLSKLSPTITSGSQGAAAGYSNINPATAVTDSLSAKEFENAEKMSAENYKRKLTEKIKLESNKRNEIMSMYEIAKENEEFQEKMAKKELAKIKSKGKLSKIAYLNFKTKALLAKANAIKAGQEYDVSGYELASTMGRANAKLPKKVMIQTMSQAANSSSETQIHDLKYYLDLAVKNRPDLKADKYKLKAAKLDLYSAAESTLPNITANNDKAGISTNITPGKQINKIRGNDADYHAVSEQLKKKWITIAKEVRTSYSKLQAAVSLRNEYSVNLAKAKKRRNILEHDYIDGKTDMTALNQAQRELISTKKSYVKSKKNVNDAEAELMAACGIEDISDKKNYTAELNQAQKAYKDISRSLLKNEINIKNARAGLNAATGMQ